MDVRKAAARIAGTGIIYSEFWDEQGARDAAKACGGIAIGFSPYGSGYAVEVPADKIEECKAMAPGAPDEVALFGGWDELGTGEDAFEMLKM